MSKLDHQSLAVIGMHGRFPRAADLAEFFDNLVAGQDAITAAPEDRFGKDSPWRGGFIDAVDCFDGDFFNILPREAQSMDPQQRLFLQTAWAALEDAGYSPKALAGRKIGVFVGIGNADYPVLMRTAGASVDAYRATGIALTSIANRVSFSLDLLGPSQSIDTACSSSLVAVHRAAAALRNGECEMCIVGGVNLLLGTELFEAFQSAGMLSPTGHCHVFDAAADGYVRGEGVAAIILRPLEAAEAARDHIYGVISASAENHGGRAHSFTAPNVNAQADVICTAWKHSGVSIADALLLELHGTGTPLGDPIEFNGLKKALGSERCAAEDKIHLGLLKSHIGHLEATAGIAGLVKTVLSLRHGVIPGNLHHSTTNPHINFTGTPFALSTSAVEWDRYSGPRYAGVSSFGFGGVNAHVVLQSYKSHRPVPVSVPEVYLFPLSAKTKSALRARVAQLLNFISAEGHAEKLTIDTMRCAILTALGLPESYDDATGLRTLFAAPEQFSSAISKLSKSLNTEIDPSELRDVLTLGELSHRLAVASTSGAWESSHAKRHLMPRTAIVPRVFDAAVLSQVSFTLIEGRDTLRERVVFVAERTADLANQLQAYLDAPEDSPSGPWHAGAPRTNTHAQPSARIADVGADAWSEYFTTTRDAVLTWEAVSATPQPGRIPLPAYPFALTRTWFQSAENAITHNLSEMRSAPTELRFDTTATWHGIWPTGSARPQSSATALPYLIQHLSQQHSGQIVLRDVRFGKPEELTGGDPLRFKSQRNLTQCLSGATSQRVLLQAHQHHQRTVSGDYPVLAPVAPPTKSSSNNQTDGLAQIVTGPQWNVRNITQAEGQISIHASPSATCPDERKLLLIWSAIIAGAQALQNSINSQRLAPYRIKEIVIQPGAALQVEHTFIRWHEQTQSASVVCTNTNGDIVFDASGLVLKPEPALVGGTPS